MRFSQAGILECVAASFSRGSSWPRDRTHISCGSCTAGRFLMTEPPGKPQEVKGQCIEPSEFSSWLQTYRWFFRPDHRQTRKLSSAGFMGISVTAASERSCGEGLGLLWPVTLFTSLHSELRGLHSWSVYLKPLAEVFRHLF